MNVSVCKIYPQPKSFYRYDGVLTVLV